MIHARILCAGFGGQGVMSLGQLLAYGGMLDNRHVSWIPSYGPEMRGGTAYCCVVISDRPIGSPMVVNDAGCVIVMNSPSLLKFEKSVITGGILLTNSSLISEPVTRRDILVYSIPAGDLARDCGSPKSANIVMLGAYLALTGLVKEESIIAAFDKVFGRKSPRFHSLNRVALAKGAEAVLDLNRPRIAA